MVESVMAFLNIAVYGCFIAALVALPFFVMNMIRAVGSMPLLASAGLRASRTPFKSVLFFVTPIAAVFLLTTIISIHARNDTSAFLASLPASPTVLINGKRLASSDAILSALKEVRPVMAHHSHPTTTITIDISANAKTLRLTLGRDSQNRDEYWVFYPKYRVTSINEIGRIFTDALRAY